MDYYVKSVVPIIKMNYEKFTTVERSIADFFIRNQERVDLSSKAMADRLYVSEASLSRFAQKCGYRGYRELVYQYEQTFVEERDTITDNTRMILNAYQELLNKTYSLVDEEQIARIGTYLARAERVIVCGCGSSGYAAAEMELRFMRIGVNIRSAQDSDWMHMQAVFQNPHCLVFGISVSGETEPVLYLLQESYRRGAKTVLITAEATERFRESCTEVLRTPSLRYLNHGNVISPQFPVLLMIDILYSYYAAQDKSRKELMHDDTLRALDDSKVKRRIKGERE